MKTEFYYLQSGDALEIGDQYETASGWEMLTENEYSEWVTFSSHYWPEKYPEMSRFRRSKDKDPRLAERTREIFNKALGA